MAILSHALLLGCADHEQTLDEQISRLHLQTLPAAIDPPANPSSPKKIELGRLLFYDPIISGEKNIACYSCHVPAYGYSEPLDLSRGPGGGGIGLDRLHGNSRLAIRNSTTVLNSAFVGLRDVDQELDVVNAPMTWTINRRTLELQATNGALVNPTHMRGSGNYDANVVGDTLANRLRKITEYVKLFDEAFGGGANGINKASIGGALGAFQRHLVAENSPYDNYVNGNKEALTEQQKKGLLLFFGKAHCSNCHSGPMFSDYALYNIGVNDHPLVTTLDLGANNLRLFRTPSIRNATLTAPYMHNGTVATLRDVVEFYNSGVPLNPNIAGNEISVKIKPLHLSEDEINALLSFLDALTDNNYDKVIPPSVPSGLKVGGK